MRLPVVLVVLVASLAAAAPAVAVEGVLTQKAGTEGCVSLDTTGGACQDGRALDLADETALSPDGENLYVGVSLSDAVAVFDRDPLTGQLRQKDGLAGCVSDDGTSGDCTNGTALDDVDGVVVSADGENVYAAAQASDSVVVFDRDVDTGALTQTGCVSDDGTGGDCVNGFALDGAVGLAISDDGENLYAVAQFSDSVVMFDRNTSTGAITEVSCVAETTADGCADGAALDTPYPVITLSPDQKNLYVPAHFGHAVVSLSRDLGTGAIAQIGCVSDDGTAGACDDGDALRRPDAVLVTPDGTTAYSTQAESASVSVFSRDGTTGDLTQTDCISEDTTGGACTDGTAILGALGLGMDPDGETLYVAGQLSNAIAVFDIAADGSIAQKAGTAGCISEDGTGGLCADGAALVQPRGRLSVSSDGLNLYVPTQGSDSVAIFDRGLNSRPTCTAVTATVVHDVPIGIPLQCADTDGDAFTREIVAGPQHGTLGTLGSTVQYTPAAGYVGSDSFTFRASDAGGAGGTVTVGITVTNSAPSCSAGSASVAHGSSVSVQLSCTDSDDPSLTLAVASGPSHGSVGAVNQLTRQVTYTAGAFVGADSFTFTATDATGAKATATVSLTLTGTAPVCTNVEGKDGAPVKLACSDAEGDALTLKIVSGPANGTLGPITDGAVTYTARSGFSGTDSFTFAATALDGESAAAKATLAVTSPPAVVPITQIATLPPKKVCVSRRHFRIHLRNVGKNKVVRAQIRLNGKVTRAVKGKALSLPIDLRGLPKGKFKVEIVTTDKSGKRVVGRRTYRTCVPKRRS